MESLVLEEAFPTWKMLDELVDTLLKPGTTDRNTIQTLANMVMSKEFSRTFIYNKEPGISFQEYEDIVSKYRSFTMWLLGRFFYLLSCDDDEIIIDAQLSIIDQLSRTQVHVYSHLAHEYCRALNIMSEYLKKNEETVTLVVFELTANEELSKKLNLKRANIELSNKKMCLKLVKKLLKIINFIMVESISFYSMDAYSYLVLNDLLFLVSAGYFQSPIFRIFINMLQHLNYNSDAWSIDVIKSFQAFSSLFEQYVYEYYNNNNLDNVNSEEFNNLLSDYLRIYFELKINFGHSGERIGTFLVNLSLSKNLDEKPMPTTEIIALYIKHNSQHTSSIADQVKKEIDCVIRNNLFTLFPLLTPFIFKEICDYSDSHSHKISINVLEASETWKLICYSLNSEWNQLECNENVCQMQNRLHFCINIFQSLLNVKLKFINEHKTKDYNVYFFTGNIVIPTILLNIAKHYSSCQNLITPRSVLNLLVRHLNISDCNNMDIIFHLISCKLLLNICYKSTAAMPNNYIGIVNVSGALKKSLSSLYHYIANDKRLNSNDILVVLNEFFNCISTGLIKNFNQTHMDQIEMLHMKLLRSQQKVDDPVIICQIIENVPQLLSLFSDKDGIFNLLLPLLSSQHGMVQQKITEVIPTILCTSSNDYKKVISAESVKIVCNKCDNAANHTASPESGHSLIMPFSRNRVDISAVTMVFLKNTINFLIGPFNEELKIKTIKSMPSISQHVVKFSSPDVTKIWIEVAGQPNFEIRKTLAVVIRPIIENGQNNPDISEAIKTDILDIVFSVLLRLSKKSLQYSESEHQDTLLTTIDEIGQIEHSHIKLEAMKIMLYFVMAPMSYHSFLAVSRCSNLSVRDGSGQLSIYRHNAEALCEVIVHMCYSNQYIIKASLQESLVKVSVMLGFDGVKDFVSKEAKKLLPYLVAKTVKNSNVTTLIDDMAIIMEIEVSDLLTRNYGNIFLHIFLGSLDRTESKQCLTYLETRTNLSGRKLRKMNIRVILNELLLNFHEKRQQVLTTFQLLLDEDNTTQASSIEEYLEPYFLAFLLYFDLELTSEYSKKEKILLSLADVLKFLGPNRIMPLRFKIIAMLQTTQFLKHPELTCTLWDSFIHSCEIECLGPHLATIFISMLSLIEACPNSVNRIFQYLVVENERNLSDYIVDLFFVNNSYLSSNVLAVIKKHVRAIEKQSLKEKMQRFLKYLKHDTLEVRIQSLRQLKTCLEENREELDQMILGYNGIDDVVVELIDYLTLGCREKDGSLKLACGDIFGELGAIEPSHLPRRYAHDSHSFIFFISEDAFIESALNELIKAFQTDKNARNTDRVALAIQELLKTYEISPSESSSRNFMWNKFPEAHREVMTPLLSSKYICVEKFTGYPCPLYGTSDGSSFQSWLYNWTSSLISTLPPEKRSLLQSCFPSMKLDKRVLMHFLPYILLHSLLEGSSENEEKSAKEFEAILKSFNTKRTIDDKILNNRPLPIPGREPTAREITAEEEKQIKCTRVVFILFDFLDRWLREWQWHKGVSAGTDRNYQKIKQFLGKFCKLELSKCNYKCGEYSRALMYLEDFIAEHPDQISSNLQFLGEIYAQLDEPDGVLGVEPLQQEEPSLEQKVLSLEVSGKLNDAVAIYEHMPRPLKLQHIQGLLQCYLDLDKVNTALYCAEGAIDQQPEFGNMLLEMQATALWRLGTYSDLENLLNKPDISDNKSWGIQVGRSLVCIKKGKRDEFKEVLESIKKQQVDSFGAASLEEGAYHHGYSYITHLHCLNELEQLEKTISDLSLKPNDHKYSESIMNKLSNEWQLRIKVVQESVRVIEPILCIRRVALTLARDVASQQSAPYFDKLLGETWLQSVNVARVAGINQQAYTYVLDTEKYNPPKLFIEKAKLHWLREEHEEALITLKRGLNVYIPDNASSQETQQAIQRLSIEKRKLCAEARLLIATYNNDICSVDVETNLQQYKEAVEVYKEWEKSVVCLAQYQDRIFQNYSDEEKDTKAKELQLHIIHNFGKSLSFGTTYVYQSMPRLLSVWFDYGTRLLDVSNTTLKEERRLILVKMTKIIDSFLTKLPAFVFLTSFSQIISRIAHPQKEVYVQLKSIIIKLMQHYPQQCLWMISSVIKSSYPMRATRCADILNDPRLKTQTMSKLVKDFTSFAEKLIELCNKEIPPDVQTTNVSLLVRALPRMLNKGDFSEIMMPTHKFRKLILPNPDFKNTQHNPFPNHYVHIVGIDDNISILSSLQRPRKISLRGSDGVRYTFMLKPKDDLRKDFRLMEFNDIVNHLLMRDAEARQRRLNIRLYSVAPLNEECGLIEWINDLVGLRPVVMSLYKQRGLGMRPKEIKENCCNVRDPLSKKRELFKNVLLKMHPPILGEWFRKTFPDAQTWLTARTGYIRTTAVISITGYMLGLGDRHGENILLDSTCGDVVHVDFNCLFNKGETFEWPERVPFRLTQNMISAMGPLGVEGVFRKSCEFTLRVLRSNTATLMSIVTPFVYDPLVSWPRKVPASEQSSERMNEQALEHIKNIELRLQGKVKTRSRTMSQCLSIEGQVDYLINEAKSLDNLCQMYIGWGPYL